jgi:hypothetical protein
VQGRRTSTAVSQSEFTATLLVSKTGAGGSGSSLTTTFTDNSTQQEFTRTSHRAGDSVLEDRVRWRFESSTEAASDCSWRPARVIVADPLRVGAHWTSSASCTDVVTNAKRTRDDTADVVRTDSFLIGSTPTPVYVIKRVSVERTNGEEQDLTAEEWYAPSLGTVVKQMVESRTPGAATYARDSKTEWWITAAG